MKRNLHPKPENNRDVLLKKGRKTVFFIDAAAEFSLKIPSKRLGNTDAVKASVSFDILDKKIDALQGFFVL